VVKLATIEKERERKLFVYTLARDFKSLAERARQRWPLGVQDFDASGIEDRAFEIFEQTDLNKAEQKELMEQEAEEDREIVRGTFALARELRARLDTARSEYGPTRFNQDDVAAEAVELTMETLKQIQNREQRAAIVFDAAKAMAEIYIRARKEYGPSDWDSDDNDEELMNLVFPEE
jgi:hypothetical protein